MTSSIEQVLSESAEMHTALAQAAAYLGDEEDAIACERRAHMARLFQRAIEAKKAKKAKKALRIAREPQNQFDRGSDEYI